ncbi:zinc-ribbon domain-containing protein [Lentibacter algarum]|uniref:zinc-ribbon domain-containing protein n=1 Tax=Lentibacter algarum TaxID=576131 RepID=UPI001C0A44DF|nr:zinc-ribbon domain-containing protein [Lentibacter algarum]MBU2983574.1 zinc-ribbon domain-containing protein [Lentibacter algarum]
MRLTCPNCEAQYEVPDAVVPLSGRDVQCSNCGDTWFQHHPDNAPELSTEAPLDDDIDSDTDSDVDESYDDAPEQGSSFQDEPAPEPSAAEEPTADSQDADTPDEAPQEHQHRKRELDPSVADVLREEAARETEARQHEANTLEEQTDLGLAEPDDEAARRQREAEERKTRIRGEDVAASAAAVTATATSGSRRDVLPDIDEINSTLRKDGGPRQRQSEGVQPRENTQPAKKSSGFIRGFTIILILAILLILLYVFAPAISAAVPALEPLLSGYVSTVDSARLWLDGQVRGLMGSLDGMASEAPAEAATEAPSE